jgi:hypothetical protein
VPTPDRRPPATRSLLASDPNQRHTILAATLQSWRLPRELSTQDWSDALTRISDQLWNQEPSELAPAVVDYLSVTGPDEQLLGDLVELAVDHQGDNAAFLTAAWARHSTYQS